MSNCFGRKNSTVGWGWVDGGGGILVEVVLCNVEPAAPHVKEQKKKNNQVLF